jgi:hypothetical protein
MAMAPRETTKSNSDALRAHLNKGLADRGWEASNDGDMFEVVCQERVPCAWWRQERCPCKAPPAVRSRAV